jgi:phenylacetate-CoA ligase
MLEVVDYRYKRLSAGQTGRILVTLLSNYSFPLIRYEIGDVGPLSSESCECGRPFPLLKKVEGRTAEFLISTEGSYISPTYVIHLIGVVHNPGFIRRFQLVQQNKKEFILRLEIEPSVNKGHLFQKKQDINSDLKAVLGTGAILNMEEVSRIEETESGKFLYTVNRSGLM